MNTEIKKVRSYYVSLHNVLVKDVKKPIKTLSFGQKVNRQTIVFFAHKNNKSTIVGLLVRPKDAALLGSLGYEIEELTIPANHYANACMPEYTPFFRNTCMWEYRRK